MSKKRSSKKTSHKLEQSNNLIAWTKTAWADYLLWQDQDSKIVERINELISVCVRTPFDGIGKPEPLRANLSGFWSRRVDRAHRLIYHYKDGTLTIISCRYHYS